MDPPSRAAAPTAIGADLEPKARPTAPSGAGFSYTSTASRHINIPDNKSRRCNKDATRFGIDLTPIQNNREATFLQQEASLTESRRLGQKRNAQKDRLERAPLGLLWPVETPALFSTNLWIGSISWAITVGKSWNLQPPSGLDDINR